MDDSTIDESFHKKRKYGYTSRKKYKPNINPTAFFQNLRNSPYNNLSYKQPYNNSPSLGQIVKATKGEIKTVDVGLTLSPFRSFSLPPTPVLLNGTQSGSGFWNRIGSKTKMKSIQLRGTITQSATALESLLRMLIVYDKQANGAFPTIGQILETRDQSGAQSNSIYSNMKTESRDRFEIIKDSTWKAPSCTYTAGVQTNGPSYPGVDNEYEFNEFIKLKSRKTTYSASTGDIGDITTGSLFIIFIASQGNVWQCNWTARLRFYDN